MLDWRRFTYQSEIKKGWSADQKFCVQDESGRKFLLRISPAQLSAHRQELFNLLGQLEKLPLSFSQAQEFGYCQTGVYTLYRWIEGQDLEPILADLAVDRQEELGLAAGRMLRLIHTLPAPQHLASWQERYSAKISRKLAAYKTCGLELNGAACFLDFIANNSQLLANRPQCFTHGDYHIGNMMLADDQLVIIDFDRFDYADPWEEFNRISWCAAVSPEFATARIQSYFGGQPSEEFFRLLALYISVNAISSLPWAIPFGPAEIAVMQEQAATILSWYDRMQDPIPAWYKWSRDARPVRHHYDLLLQEGDDPFHDGPELRAHMAKFDGQPFIEALALAKTDLVLEVGVGTGRLASQILDKCQKLTGIDLSAATLARARQNLVDQAKLELHAGNFLTYNFSGQFNLIYSSLTLWHIRDKAAFYKKAAQLLLPGGRLVFTISRNQASTLDFPGRQLELYPDSPEQTKNLLEATGLRVTREQETEYSYIFAAEKKH